MALTEPRYRFDEAYSEEIALDDGTAVRLRLVRPDDAALLLEGFEHLSAESRYSRFFAARSRFTSREVDYLTHPDGKSHFAIAAVVETPQGGERGVGVARFIAMENRPGTADVAVTVIDELQHHGLGTALVTRLVEAARERGVRSLHFDILASNATMRSLLHDVAPGIQEDVEAGVATAELPVTDK